MCIEPYNQLHHLENPFANASPRSHSRSTENGFYEIGHLSIPVRELVGSGQKRWFKLSGMAAAYEIEVGFVCVNSVCDCLWGREHVRNRKDFVCVRVKKQN
jgi:hypothetical protein